MDSGYISSIFRVRKQPWPRYIWLHFHRAFGCLGGFGVRIGVLSGFDVVCHIDTVTRFYKSMNAIYVIGACVMLGSMLA